MAAHQLRRGGAGRAALDGGDYELDAGFFAFVPADVRHQFRTAPGEEPLSFVCIVPAEGDY